MKIKFNLKLFLSILFICNSFLYSFAQITYNGNILNIGGAEENGRFNLLIDKFSGLSWTFNNRTKYLHIDVTPANPRISGTGNQIVFYNSFTNTHNSIQVANVYNSSDERAKTNIQTLSSGLNTVLNLRPVSYNWKNDNNTKSLKSENTLNLSTELEREKTQYGFIAQEVEKILPDAVITDENGFKLINYTAIIPHLVQSVQELQGVVAEQKTEIENLTSQLNYPNNNISLNKITKCTPNPTSGIITFEYSLSESSSMATILITDLTGAIKDTFDCLPLSVSITKDFYSLKDGIYIATLSVNGDVKDSKQFVVRK